MSLVFSDNEAPCIDEDNLNYMVGSGIPIGGGCDYYGSTLPNDNFMWADGSAISRTTYADLFAVIGTTYGTGDGSTTFNLPDKRSRVSIMKDSTDFATLGATGGEKNHTLTDLEIPQHNHHISADGNGTLDPNYDNVIARYSTSGSSDLPYSFRSLTSFSNWVGKTSSVGNSQAHNNLQPYLVCNYIIKVK